MVVRSVKEVQVDEIRGFVQKEEGHKRPEEAHNAGIGDAYTFVAIEPHSKLVLAWHLGCRTKIGCYQMMHKLQQPTGRQRYQLTTHGFRPYVEAVENVLPSYVAFAQLVKIFASPREGETRYSPGEVVESITNTDPGES